MFVFEEEWFVQCLIVRSVGVEILKCLGEIENL